MRELKTMDIFKMSKILKKMDIQLNAEGKTAEKLGGELILQLGENLHLVENEVNEFMANLIGCTSKEFSELPIAKAFEYFEEFKKLPGIADFFKSAGRLMK